MVVGIALSMVSFLFLTQAIRRHGLRGVLFLDAAEEEVMEVQDDYNAIIEVYLLVCVISGMLNLYSFCAHYLLVPNDVAIQDAPCKALYPFSFGICHLQSLVLHRGFSRTTSF